MTVTNFGNNFEIEEDSNGDYVVTYLPTDIVIERIDSGNEEKIFEVAAQIPTLKGRTSGATVYDDATQTVGDGTTSAEHESVNTDDLLVNNGLVVGEHFEIEEDSNGDYVVTYLPTDIVIERIDSGSEEKIFEVGTRISDLVDNTSGNTVYDGSAQQFGDGNQDADLATLLNATGVNDLTDATSGNTVYDSGTETLGDGTQDGNLQSLSAEQATIGQSKTITEADVSTSGSDDNIDVSVIIPDPPANSVTHILIYVAAVGNFSGRIDEMNHGIIQVQLNYDTPSNNAIGASVSGDGIMINSSSWDDSTNTVTVNIDVGIGDVETLHSRVIQS